MLTISSAVFGQVYAPPAGIRPARRGNETSILPGGRILAPAGEQLPAGPGPSALALSPSGKTIATLNMDFSLTEMERGQPWDLHELPLTRGAGESGSEDAKGGAPRGLVFFREHSVFLSEGNSGRVALVDLPSGQRRSSYDVDRNGHHDSFTGDLAIDTARNILYVADLTNKRVLAIDTRLGPIDAKPRGILASLELSGRPYLMALSPDRKKLYVTERESDAVSVIDTSEPASAKLETIIRTLSPAGIVATADRRALQPGRGGDSHSYSRARTVARHRPGGPGI